MYGPSSGDNAGRGGDGGRGGGRPRQFTVSRYYPHSLDIFPFGYVVSPVDSFKSPLIQFSFIF